MSWTSAVAVFGAITGAGGLAWQLLNYRLTGGRIQLFATRWKLGEYWKVRTTVTNVGRQDVTIVGYSVWLDLSEGRLKRMVRQFRDSRRSRLDRTGRHLMNVRPSVHIRIFGTYSDDGGVVVSLPAVLKAGSVLTFPRVGFHVEHYLSRQCKVAVVLASGRIIRASVLSRDDIMPSVHSIDEIPGEGDIAIVGDEGEWLIADKSGSLQEEKGGEQS